MIPITVAYGDGIGPEIMAATMAILKAAGAPIEAEIIQIGEKVYQKGILSGIGPEAWESLARSQAFLKAPITTPQGGGYKSLNVTIRKKLGLYANIRPCQAYGPFIQSRHPKMNLVIVRENEEDLYGGIEYQLTPDVTEAVKLITNPGSERLIRYGFAYAQQHQRQKVTCLTKDNIMKMTDGLFHKIFDDVAKEYPTLKSEHWIVDIGTAKVANKPEEFDVIIVPNLYGDILSDVAAEISGSVGMAGSANIGKQYAMFEAIHGSAPKRAGQDAANPSGLLQSAVLMLLHLGQTQIAAHIQNAWLKTLEDGIHTYDIYDANTSKKLVGTQAFTAAVIDRLGQMPQVLPPAAYRDIGALSIAQNAHASATFNRELEGTDVFIYAPQSTPAELAVLVERAGISPFKLHTISNRGTALWPNRHADTLCCDQWCLRFKAIPEQQLRASAVFELLQRLDAQGLDIVKNVHLYRMNGKAAYSLSQGE